MVGTPRRQALHGSIAHRREQQMTVARVLLPKEHGAYGQISLPLATAFGAAGFSSAGVLFSAAVVAGFLAHEPAAIVMGFRGPRVKRERGAPAVVSLGVCLLVSCGATLAAAIAIPAQVRWSLLVPAIPAAILAGVMIAGREKTWYGELLAAVAFAGVAVPIVLAAGAPASNALAVAIPFALLFVASTLAVRVVIVRVRGGGQPREATATRRATLTLALGSIVLIGALTAVEWLVPTVLIASSPGLLMAAVVAVRPPSPARLRSLGWSLVGVSILTAVLVVSTLGS
jgi:hypothetical protein